MPNISKSSKNFPFILIFFVCIGFEEILWMTKVLM